ncbi:helix-turn-helix transcriptional regulator [Curtanaerobium respiraculi]|uniref:helix-turn-helix transcriptional regulator n=1 Tax=Curtanaerobium respiraculi TaxID=2949669 RepID=UPI0024B3731E|nr:LuxR C-terminal-related transcriptional regulator [Curtanaerobium respiraculi]
MANELRRTSGNALSRAFAGLQLSFFGLALVRVWIQCILYDRYLLSDAGVVSLGINFPRAAITLILVAIIVQRGFPPAFRRALTWLSIPLMTLAGVLFLLGTQSRIQGFDALACWFAATGIVWGGGMWMQFYLRLEPVKAFICAMGSLGLGSLLGLLVGFLPQGTCYMISIALPTLSLVSLRRAMALTGAASLYEEDPASQDTVYDREPVSTVVRVNAGIALLMFAVGVLRGFPTGEPIPFTLAQQLFHQLGVVTIVAVGVYAVCGRGFKISYALLWRLEIGLILLSIVLMGSFPGGLPSQLGTSIASIANTCMLCILWFTCYDIARHSSTSPYATLGIAWAVFLLSREIGRWTMLTLALDSGNSIVIVAALICIVSAATAVLISDSIPRVRPFYSDLSNSAAGKRSAKDAASGKSGRSEADSRTSARGATASAGAVATADPPIEPGRAPGRADCTGAVDSAAPDGMAERIGQTSPAAQESDLAAPPSATARGTVALQPRLIAEWNLTEREAEVVELMLRGNSKARIGDLLFISENTVRSHAKSAYAKLGVHNKNDLHELLD